MNQSACFSLERFLYFIKCGDISPASLLFFDEFHRGPEFRKHVIDAEVAFLHISAGLRGRDLIQRLFVRLAKVDEYLFHIG